MNPKGREDWALVAGATGTARRSRRLPSLTLSTSLLVTSRRAVPIAGELATNVTSLAVLACA
eukprot:7043334-Pyramimonas_sp.AAC.1